MKTLLRSFAGGEVAPGMFSRLDDARFSQGAAKCRNLIVTPQGPVERRNGSRFIASTKVPAERSRFVTFRFSSNQSYAVQIGAGFFRFYSGCEMLRLDTTPRDYISSKNLSAGAFNTGTPNEILFSAAHNLIVGDPIILTGNHPSEFDSFTTYYAIVVSSTIIKLAATAANAAAGTAVAFVASAPATARAHFVYETRDLVRFAGFNFYVKLRNPLDTTPAGGTPAACTTSGTNVTQASHGYVEGTSVVFGGALLPPQITAGSVYYVLNPAGGSYNISATPGGAAISMAIGSGTANRADHWHQLTDDIYEVPNDFAESDLPDVTWDTSFDVLTIAHKNHDTAELRRFDTLSWDFVPLIYGPSIAAPAFGFESTTPGATLNVTAVGTNSGYIEFHTEAEHQLAVGDTVLWTGGTVQSDTGFPLFTPLPFTVVDFYTVALIPSSTTFCLRTYDGAAKVVVAGAVSPYTLVGTPVFRVTSLAAELSHTYQVTAVDIDGLETLPSEEVSVTNNLLVDGASNLVKWSPIAGATRYKVYKKKNGLFGFMGAVEHVEGAVDFSFVDSNLANIAPDLGITPPRFDDTLSGTDHPGAVAHFEQRRVLAGSLAFPQRLWMTRTGTENDLSLHIPLLDDDRILLDVASREAETIRHIVPMAQLILLTDATEYRLTPVNSDAITPTSVAVRAQSYVGANGVQPVVVNNTLVFAAARGGHLREMGFQSEAGSFVTGDLSLRASHLFDGFTISDLCFSKAPHPVVWAVSSSGDLLGLTYSPEESVGAWHVHELGGVVETCTSVQEGENDNLYLVVKRTINDNEVRYIECLTFEKPATFADNFFVDCGVTKTGALTTVTGLDHLEGEDVVALVDGVVVSGLTVASGQVTLPLASVAKVQIGLPMRAYLETLPLIMQIEGFGTGNTKNDDMAFVRVLDSCQFQVGPAGGQLVTRMPDLSNTEARTAKVRVTVMPKWDEDGRLLLQQSLPLPLTIVGVTIAATPGG